MMKEKTFALYRSFVGCLLLTTLFACASVAPHQQISEAKQALMSAVKLSREKKLNEAERLLLQSAYDRLQQAESALQDQRYNDADLLSAESKRLSQRILKDHRPQQKKSQSQFNFQYRY